MSIGGIFLKRQLHITLKKILKSSNIMRSRTCLVSFDKKIISFAKCQAPLVVTTVHLSDSGENDLKPNALNVHRLRFAQRHVGKGREFRVSTDRNTKGGFQRGFIQTRECKTSAGRFHLSNR